MIGRVTIGLPARTEVAGVEDFHANIVLEPPIVIGEGFEETIIGQDPLQVGLTHIASTQAFTILEARTGSLRDFQERRLALKHMADRIVKLVANPESAAHMRQHRPFANRVNLAWAYSDRNDSRFRQYELVVDVGLDDPSQKA